MPEHSEHDMIEGCRQHQRYWQEQLHRRYYPVLLPICARYARSVEDAEQLLQDSFLRIFSKIHSYKNIGSFEGWMKQIVIHICLDFLRTRAAKSPSESEIKEDILDIIPGNAVQDGLHQLAFKDLLGIVQLLPDMTRTVFNLFAFEGYSHREIGALMGITEGTSSWHVHHARKRLQEQILSLRLQHVTYAGK